MTSKPEPSARRLLLVEDSVSFGYLVKTKLENKTDLDIILAGSLADAKRAVEIYNGDFFLGLLDLNLPDASGEEVFSLAKTHNIPSLVFSGSFSEDLRTKLFAAGAIDYIGKDSPHSVEYMISMIERLLANESTGAMIVDDSTSARMQIGSMLRQYRFDVHEAHDGVEAMEILEKVPNIRLVITDYNMPNMDGHELTKRIRQKFAPDRVAVIGLSAQGTTTVTAKFLKAGANDFLSKPFQREEFFCRISQNMNYLDHVQALHQASIRDAMTGLHNRRYFFESAGGLMFRSQREGLESSVGVVDIDNLKKINDAHGHLTGDEIIKHVAEIMSRSFHRGTDVVARFDGDAFCVFLFDTDEEIAQALVTRCLEKIAATPFPHEDGSIPLRATGGVCTSEFLEVYEMLGAADHAMTHAKSAGGDQVAIAENGGIDFFNHGAIIRDAVVER